jgi:hypothetical protein
LSFSIPRYPKHIPFGEPSLTHQPQASAGMMMCISLMKGQDGLSMVMAESSKPQMPALRGFNNS